MKQILLIAIALFFGLSALADHEGKKREEIVWEDVKSHILDDDLRVDSRIIDAFTFYMAEEKKDPVFMRYLSIDYEIEAFKSNDVELYRKAIFWGFKFLESRHCPTRGIYFLSTLLQEKRDHGIGKRPKSLKIDEKEINPSLHTVLVIKLKLFLKRLPQRLKEGLSDGRKNNEGTYYLTVFRKGYHEKLAELESMMTADEVRDSFLEVERLENLLGEALYDDDSCKGTWYLKEDEDKLLTDFLFETGYLTAED